MAEELKKNAQEGGASDPTPSPGRINAAGRAYLLGLAFVCGMCVMTVEMAGQRGLAPYFGSSNYVWTNVIGVILAALSLGYWMGGRIADKHPKAVVLLGLVLASGILCLGVPLVIHRMGEALIPEGLRQESAFRVVYLGSFLTTALLFAPPVFLLAMVTPFIIRLLVSDRSDAGRSSGQVYAFSTVGSIAGTFLPTLVLIPWAGTAKTLMIAALTLTVFSAAGLVLFLGRKGLAVSGAAVIAAVLVTWFASPPVSTKPGTIMETESRFQYIRVHENGEELMLSLNEGLESPHSFMVRGSSLTRGSYYDYMLLCPLHFDPAERPVLRIYVAGLAAAVATRQAHHFLEGLFTLEIDGAEIDEAVLEAGRSYFGLAGPENRNLEASAADARTDLAASRKKYDLIVVDAYARQMYVPFQLVTAEFFGLVKDRLSAGGLVCVNAVDFEGGGPLLSALKETMGGVFGPGSLRQLKVPHSANFLLLASAGPYRCRAAANLEEPGFLSRPEAAELARYVRYGLSLLKPVTPGGGLRFTDDHAPVEALMDAAFRRAAAESF